ncbi:MAG: ribosomal RNA small subunit methyltransferase A [Phycisphaerae bacterium]|nr:16S rRNA (adenine(1518)-N(6)/adenine(1519)-N(6))-dimethyltransferase RsmA [Phycisphaerae bacterium]NUQ47609.1 ribosomal RNA small subunit methyltransferase A [Phycisphaerae bacterium]
MPPFQTARDIRRLLTEAGARPRKRYGQHFLIDRHHMDKLLAAAELSREDTVIEVGAGTGSLTGLLAGRAGRVHTFEIDTTLAEIAARHVADCPHVTLHRGDALAGQSTLARELAAVLYEASGPVKLVANLPYDIATPLLLALLQADRPPVRMCFSIQREVAERLTAKPNTRDYGPAGLACRWLAHSERLAIVPRTAFWPPPKVESALMRLIRIDMSAPQRSDARRNVELVRRFFQTRRKTLSHILTGWVGRATADSLLGDACMDGRRRPESLTADEWREFLHLARAKLASAE